MNTLPHLLKFDITFFKCFIFNLLYIIMECCDKLFEYLTNNFIINSLQIFYDIHENCDGIYMISIYK